VPALQLADGRAISESLIVAQYLDETYHPEQKVRLSDPFAHAVEKLAIESFSKVVPFFYKIVLGPAEEKEENQAKFNEALAAFLNAYLKDQDFVGGKAASFGDFMVWPWLERVEFLQEVKSVKIAEGIAAKLQAYTDRMRELPAVRECLLPTSVHAKFFEGFVSGNLNWDAHLE
jgi:glutathione S-transferase